MTCSCRGRDVALKRDAAPVTKYWRKSVRRLVPNRVVDYSDIRHPVMLTTGRVHVLFISKVLTKQQAGSVRTYLVHTAEGIHMHVK